MTAIQVHKAHKHVLAYVIFFIIFNAVYGAVAFQITHFPCDNCENMCT